jgi:DNA modification methylase
MESGHLMTEIVVGNARVVLGDCRDVLRTLADSSVDSVVTDPPYELGFMGKSWDSTGIAYDVTVWEECLRVLKPGGHILAFGGSRTWHRLAVAVEDAGFEIRDSIAWIYGSGFPKSLDVSKAIDKNNGETGRKFKFTKWMKSAGITARQIDDITGTKMGSHYTTHPTQPAIPTAKLWATLRPYCGEVPGWVDELVARVEAEREVIGQGKSGKTAIWNEAGKMGNFDLTAPTTSEAQQWSGWGTALKPAFEPVVVGRKPFGKGVTVAENVLAWGVGGLNIDASRIGMSEKDRVLIDNMGGFGNEGWKNTTSPAYNTNNPDNPLIRTQATAHTQGRWPANVILDEVTAGLVDEQSGITKGQIGMKRLFGDKQIFDTGGRDDSQKFQKGAEDSGGASRFFYQAKASKRDRNEGLEGLQDSRGGSERMNNSDGRKAEIGESDRLPVTKNHHPTVKPTQLMRYLIKLVTPPGGTVLDPFTGSGSTGKAALLDGYKFVGAELTAEYMPIIEGRLRWALEQDADVDETLF